MADLKNDDALKPFNKKPSYLNNPLLQLSNELVIDLKFFSRSREKKAAINDEVSNKIHLLFTRVKNRKMSDNLPSSVRIN